MHMFIIYITHNSETIRIIKLSKKAKQIQKDDQDLGLL